MNIAIHVAGWTLVHFLWQGALLAGVAAALLRLVPMTRPRVRYAIASLTLAGMLTVPAITAARMAAALTDSFADVPAASVDARSPAVGAVVAQGSSTPHRPVAAAGGQSQTALTAVVAVWLLGVLVCLARLAAGWWRVRLLHRAALSKAPSALHATAQRLASALGLQRVVRIVDLDLVDTPTVVGWLRPVVLLPVAALANLTPAQVEAILAHELAHVRRHDYVVNLLQTAAETLLFYHPGVWWVSARIRAEREHCCDDVALRMCGDAVAYAEALEELETWRASHGDLVLAAVDGPLLERVRRVLGLPVHDQRPAINVVLMTSLWLIIVAASAAMPYFAGSSAAEPAAQPQLRQAPPPPPAPRPPDGALPGWQLTATSNFEVSYPDALATQVERIGREAEAAYAQLRMDLRHELAFKPRLVLFATRRDMELALSSNSIPGEVEHVLIPLDAPAARVRGDLLHEITHVFAFDILPGARTSLPRWIHEGLAEHERGEWDPTDAVLLRQAIGAAGVPSLSETRAAEPSGDPRLDQVVGHAAFDFIVARAGKEGLRRFLLAVRQAPPGGYASAFTAALGMTAADFDRAFAEYLRARFAARR